MRPFLLFSTLFIAVSAFASGTLFGLRNPGDGGRQVVIVDPATGAVTPVSASISAPSPAASGVNALDANGHRLFYIATPLAETDERLFAVDNMREFDESSERHLSERHTALFFVLLLQPAGEILVALIRHHVELVDRVVEHP